MFLGFLDLKAGFDSAPREEIWESLRRKNVPKNLAEAIFFKLDHKGVVRFNEQKSEVF